MLMRHHEQTRELEMRQQKSVHVLREEHLRRQHDTELTNQVFKLQFTLNCPNSQNFLVFLKDNFFCQVLSRLFIK